MSKQDELKELFNEMELDPPTTLFESPDYADAFLGLDMSTNRAVYDYQKMVESLARQDGCSEDDAREFIDFNTLRALPYAGSQAPIVVDSTYLQMIND